MALEPALPARLFVSLVACLPLALVPSVAADVGTVKVEIKVTTPLLPLIAPEPIRQQLATAIATSLEAHYRGYWRFVPGEVVAQEPGLRLHVEDGTSGGVVQLRLEPVKMDAALGSTRWTSVWYGPGELELEETPTPQTGARLLTKGLSVLLDKYGEAVGKALKSVPLGVGAVWHPDDQGVVVLALPWERFEGSSLAVFRVTCPSELESGVPVKAELVTAGLGTTAPFPGGPESFAGLIAKPHYRLLGGQCQPIHDVLDDVKRFEMQEIRLQDEQATNFLSASFGCPELGVQ